MRGQSTIVHRRLLIAVGHADALRDVGEDETSKRNQEQNRHAGTEPEGNEHNVDDECQAVVHEENWATVDFLKLRHGLCSSGVSVTRAQRFLVHHALDHSYEQESKELGDRGDNINGSGLSNQASNVIEPLRTEVRVDTCEDGVLAVTLHPGYVKHVPGCDYVQNTIIEECDDQDPSHRSYRLL